MGSVAAGCRAEEKGALLFIGFSFGQTADEK